MYSCLLRVTSSLDMGRNVLKHHDRIIHNHTNSNRERTEGDNIQRISRNKQVDEGGNKRNWNRQDNDKCSLPATKEDKHNEHHDEEGDEDCLLKVTYRTNDEVRGINEVAHLHVRREGGLDTWEQATYLLCNLHGVGSILLINNDDCPTLTIHIVLLLALCDSVLDLSYIT